MADILLLVQSTTSLGVIDAAVQASLVGAGHTVTLRDDAEAAVPADVLDYDCGVACYDIVPGFGTAYRDVALPFVVMDRGMWRTNFSMTEGSVAPGVGTDITVQSETSEGVSEDGEAHPIAVAAGLSAGSATVYSETADIARDDGVPATARSVAWHFNSARKCLFTFDEGDEMAGSILAPARRVGYGAGEANVWADRGEPIFLASVAWAIGGEDPGDETAPTLSNATASSTGATTASGSVDTDEGNGTLYWVVTTSDTAPSAAQVQAGQDHTGSAAVDSGSQAVTGTGTQNVSGDFTGLTASTGYYAHFQHQDAAENDSDVASSSQFTTAANVVQSEAVAFVENESLAATTAATHIAGTVTLDSDPVEGLAVIALHRADDTASVTTTNASGEYVFAGLEPDASYMVMPEPHEDDGTFYRANPAIRTPSVNGN